MPDAVEWIDPATTTATLGRSRRLDAVKLEDGASEGEIDVNAGIYDGDQLISTGDIEGMELDGTCGGFAGIIEEDAR